MISLVLVGLCLPAGANAELVITEIMSQSNHQSPTEGDWWELTNTGPAAINLLGYSWDDDHQRVAFRPAGPGYDLLDHAADVRRTLVGPAHIGVPRRGVP